MFFTILRFDPESVAMSAFLRMEGPVWCMSKDMFNPGQVLFGDGCALKSTNGESTRTIAGQARNDYLPDTPWIENKYVEGVGESARFKNLRGIYQHNETHVLVVDSGNHCIRLIDHITGQTEPFIGSCKNMGYRDGLDARFEYPGSFLVDSQAPGKLFIVEYNKIRHVEIFTKLVSTFLRTTAIDIVYPNDGITQDSATGDIYLVSALAVWKLSYEEKVLELVVGQPAYSDWSESLLRLPSQLLLIGNRTKLLITDTRNNRLVVHDMITNTTSFLCDSGVWNVVESQPGNSRQCILNQPRSLLVDGDTLFVGGYKFIMQMKAEVNSDIVEG